MALKELSEKGQTEIRTGHFSNPMLDFTRFSAKLCAI